MTSTTSPLLWASSILTLSPPCSRAFCRSSLKTSASAVARLPAIETELELCMDFLSGGQPLHEHRAQPLEQLAQLDDLFALLRQDFMHGGDCEDAIHGILERLARVGVRRSRLQAEERCDRLEVVLDAVVDLLREHAAHHGSPVLERDRGVMCDRREQRALLVGERCVAVADELADLAPLPAQRQADVVRPRPPLGPRDVAVLEHERRAGRADRFHRRLHDRLERLFEIERLGDRLGDLRERLQLGDPALGLRVELGVLDRLRDLVRDRHQ